MIQSHHQLQDVPDVGLLKHDDDDFVVTMIVGKFTLSFYVLINSSKN